MKVRPFENDDEPTFLRLCEEFYNSGATARGYDESIALKTFRYIMSKHENLWGYFMLDAETQQIVGYSLLTSYWCNEDGGNVIILDELYICPVDRHRGYGQLFLQWIQQEFHEKAVSITLEVVTTNTIAKQLYAKMGFTEDGFEVLSKPL